MFSPSNFPNKFKTFFSAQGNPYENCYFVECRTNPDCPQDKACIQEKCVNPCYEDNPCAPTAECRWETLFVDFAAPTISVIAGVNTKYLE